MSNEYTVILMTIVNMILIHEKSYGIPREAVLMDIAEKLHLKIPYPKRKMQEDVV